MNHQATETSQEADRRHQLSVVPAALVPVPRSMVARALDKVVPGKNRFLGLLWLLAVAALFTLFANIQGEATRFAGIAESEQQAFSFQYPVEIIDIPVVEGQRVDERAVLLRARRYDLDVDFAVVDQQLNQLKAELASNRQTMRAQIAGLGAERQAKIEALNTDINSLASRYQLNQALLNSINSSTDENSANTSPILTRLSGLRAEQQQLDRLYQTRIRQAQQKLADLDAPGEARIAELNRQRQELNRQNEALVVHAPFAGSVGSVLFKPGELVDAFRPVVSLHGEATRQIKGFIHEAVINDIQVGQPVWVKPMDSIGEQALVAGMVESLGSRIVEYPDRLKRSQFISAWGREAIIRVSPANRILLDAKVSVLMSRPETLMAQSLALLDDYLPIAAVRAWAGEAGIAGYASPDIIKSRMSGLQTRQIEASGVIWNPAINAYHLISDEQASLFEMNLQGDIVGGHSLDAYGKFNDLESISRDDNYIYLATSLSHNKQGKLKPARRQFLRLKVDKNGIHDFAAVDLYAALESLGLSADVDANTRRFLTRAIADKSLDLEAHAVMNNRLYLGFKAPLDDEGNTVFLALEGVDRLFEGGAVSLSAWRRLALDGLLAGENARLTDLVLADDFMLLLAVADSGKGVSSSLLGYDLGTEKFDVIAEFAGLRAEGLSIDRTRGMALVVFDGNGKWPSQYRYVSISKHD